MFAAGRLEKVRELLQEHKKIDVLTLVRALDVSEATVRRDLEKLEEEKFLVRTHGGAVLVEQEQGKAVAEIELSEEKKQIAEYAANLVNNNEIIYVGGGSTCLQFALALKEKKDVTIVTSNLWAAVDLAGLPNLNVMVTGGAVWYRESSISTVGEFAYHMLENIFVDKVFLGADGVDLKFGFSYTSPDQVNISKKAMKMSDQVILMCDHSKFGRKALSSLCPLTSVSMVVTNQNVPPEYKSFFFDNNIPIITNYDF
ncbi:DeoR family transcriptional regulator [Bacteroidia bacterium]|nr:DeoR family transcriptional regulator [Bacteroidia bacterium]